MGANRKLQAEIDRTLKRVQEGIAEFDEIWDKVYDTDNANQKEKYEADLKKEIKKLQRYRDQIKTWVSSTDIKDKTDLMNARKRIEREMERFKVCEKETKTKAFSKEGLGLAAKLDPKEQKRIEARERLNDMMVRITTEMDEFEAEIESLQSNKRKAKPPPRLTQLEELVSRHKQHYMRLEQLLRLMENEGVTPEEVGEVMDILDDYLERHQEEMEEFEDPDTIYGEGLLEQLDGLAAAEQVGAVPHVPAPAKKEPKEKEKDRETERARERERAAALAAKQQLAALGTLRGSELLPTIMEEDASKKQTPPRPDAPPKSTPSTPPRPPTLAVHPKDPGAENPTSAAGGVSLPSTPPAAQASPFFTSPQPVMATSVPPPPPASAALLDADGVHDLQAMANGGGAQNGRAAAGGAAAAAAAGPAAPRTPLNWSGQLPADARGPPGAPAPTAMAAVTSAAPPQPPPQQAQPKAPGQAGATAAPAAVPGLPARGPMPVSQGVAAGRPAEGAQTPLQRPAAAVAATQAQSPPPPQQQQQQQQQELAAAAPSQDGALQRMGAGDPEHGAEDAQAGPGSSLEIAQLTNELLAAAGPLEAALGSSPAANLSMMQACAHRCFPLPIDGLWQSGPTRTRAPPGGVPASYPQQKLPILDNPALYEKMDNEALFFSFYYQPGTYQQYLAARELKRQSWRYHKQHGAWFQRHEEPKISSDEYELGTYVYFDYNIMHDDVQSGWCYRLKQDFTFRYDALEDELQ